MNVCILIKDTTGKKKEKNKKKRKKKRRRRRDKQIWGRKKYFWTQRMKCTMHKNLVRLCLQICFVQQFVR